VLESLDTADVSDPPGAVATGLRGREVDAPRGGSMLVSSMLVRVSGFVRLTPDEAISMVVTPPRSCFVLISVAVPRQFSSAAYTSCQEC
jgi:hypothetical protein